MSTVNAALLLNLFAIGVYKGLKIFLQSTLNPFNLTGEIK